MPTHPQASEMPMGRPFATIVLLGLILLIGAGLRIHRLNEKSLWYDEFISAELPVGNGYAHRELPLDVVIERPPNLFDLNDARPIASLWYSELQAHLPPLYVLAMRLWGETFGLAQGSVRAFSLIMSLAAVAMLFAVSRELAGVTTALWAALLMAIAPTQIQYAQEARNYAMLLLEGLAAAWLVLRIERRGSSRLREAMLVLWLLALTLTHHFSIGAVLALAVYSALRLRGGTRKRVLGCFVVAALLWGVLGAPLALRQVRNLSDASTEFLEDRAPGHVLRNLQRACVLPVRLLVEPMANKPGPAAAGGIIFLLALLLPIRRRELLFWSMWLWLTVLPLFLLDAARHTSHLHYIRYSLLASPAVYVIVASLLADRRGWIAHLPPAVAALACLLAINVAYDTWWKVDWRVLASRLDENVRPGDVIVFWQGGGYYDFPSAAFLHTSYYRKAPLGPMALLNYPPDDSLIERLRKTRGVLVVTYKVNAIDLGIPAAQLFRIDYEPGAGALWRLQWMPATRAASPAASAPSTQPG